MPHLSLEALARLVDEPPTPEEAAHLDGCARCAGERRALAEQTAALAGLAPPTLPHGIWKAVRRGVPAARPGRGRRARRAMRAAAVVAVFLAGTAFGMRVGGSEPAVAGSEPDQAPVDAVAEAGFDPEGITHPGSDAVTRIVTLEAIVATTRAALAEAPGDPVINGYHLSARELRDRTLRAIGVVEEDEDEGWF